MKKSRLMAAVFAVMSFVISPITFASTTLVDLQTNWNPNGGNEGIGAYCGSPYCTFGYSFTLNDTIVVDSLGAFDFQADGLAQSHSVDLWDSSGALLASTTVSNASAS